MTPEAWQIALIIIGGLFGSAGLFTAFGYYIRARADVQKIQAETAKDTRIKQLEIQLTQVQARREKSQSDEKQTDKLIASNNQLLFMLGTAINHLRESEKQRETEYQVTKGLYDRTNQEIREVITGFNAETKTLISNARADFVKVITDMRSGIQADLQAAVLRNQAMAATRSILTTWDIGFKFPEESDRRWQRCQITFSHTEALIIHKAPVMNDDNQVSTIKSGMIGWFIPERWSCLTGWAAFRDEHSPDIRGWFLTDRTVLADCQYLTSGVTNKIPVITMNAAPG